MTNGLKRETIRHDWIEALRSGEYPQGNMYLNSRGSYCCLGVLCEVVIEHGVPLTKDDGDFACRYGGCIYMPPPSVMHVAGVDNVSADGETNLTAMNDKGVRFAVIADRLESGAFWMENS